MTALMSHPRLANAVAAGVLAVPLVVAPVLAPVAAFASSSAGATLVDDRGDGWGASPYGGTTDPWATDPWVTTQQATTIDSQPATTAESTGVVLIETQIDWGTGEAAGTGLVLDSDGIVVTNHHVVQGATEITVTVPGTDASYVADVVGYDAKHDVAVLRLRHASGLTTVTTDTSAVQVDDEVTAVGNAEGAGSLTAADGTVTQARKAITVQEDDGTTARLRGLIEVDADVVSGDSGGALLDADGRVIGMNVAASSGSVHVSGYAIPVSRVLTVADRILAGDDSGAVVIGYEAALGVQLSGASSTVVAATVDGGGAAGVGVEPGSTIRSLDGSRVTTLQDLVTVLARHVPGDTVRIVWVDASGARHAGLVTLGRAPLA
ncbi:MAG: trypsin-like peptidase domain-containing protein [Nocardioidaceae bacterium]